MIQKAMNIGPWASSAEASVSDERRHLRAARRGSKEAVEQLVREHWSSAFRTAYLIVGEAAEAEDIAQEALMAALNGLPRYKTDRPFSPWLRRIVVNRSLDALRGQARRDRNLEAAAATPRPAGDDGIIISDPVLASAIEALPADQRVAVVMRYALGFSTDEIASYMKVPRGTVGSRLRRGLDGIREQLEEARDEHT